MCCTVLLQAANASQQKLESEVSIFLSMVKNEENCGKSPGNGHISMQLIHCPFFKLWQFIYQYLKLSKLIVAWGKHFSYTYFLLLSNHCFLLNTGEFTVQLKKFEEGVSLFDLPAYQWCPLLRTHILESSLIPQVCLQSTTGAEHEADTEVP